MLDFNHLKKNLKKPLQGFKRIKLGIISDSASQFLITAVKGYGIETGISFEIYEGEYNQVNAQVFDTSSELYRFNPDYIFLNFSSEHLLKKFYKNNAADRTEFSTEQIQYIRDLCKTITSMLDSIIIVNNFIEINDSVFGNFANKVTSSFVYQVRKTNLLMMDLCQKINNLYICDLNLLQSELGYGYIFDSKMYIAADMVFSIDFLPHLAKCLTDIVMSISGSFKKCVILDLDNTLWGGIIGDDGIEGIQIGDLGIGKAFSEFQLWLKQLQLRGILLAISSKNTESIAQEVFDKHPDMILKMNDIAVFAANWENKVDNVNYIQKILNIGFESIVFLDDNKFEREMVKTAIPDITVPSLPDDPADYLTFLRTINLFETASFTNEDEQRTRQYQDEAERAILQKSFANEDEFLRSLKMQAIVNEFDKFSIPRIAQLTQRSNQFNLRTIRYTEEDLYKLWHSKDYYTFSFALSDKFGDHGLISAVIMKRVDSTSLFIDSWLMSCRVLKRGMESFTIKKIVEFAQLNNFKKIIGEYIPTKKNTLVKDHYQNLGFVESDNKWILDVAEFHSRYNFINM